MGLAPPELGQFDGWESSGEEERERWGWCRRSRRGSSRRRASPKGGDDTTVATGCCIRLWPIGSCPPPPRSKVDTSTSSASTHGRKSTENGSRNQPVASVVSGSTTTSNAESSSSASKVGEEIKVASQLRKFAFNDLKCATRNFRPESLLGEGGFGCVFKGWIEENGTAPVKPGTGLTVAVKTLNHDGLQGHKEWVVWSLPLPWAIRMKVALGAAKGLAFLHEEAGRPVIYRDFKTSNILLDAEYNAKLSDFGLAKDAPVGDKTHVSTRVMGTYGYAAPEYVMTGHLTSKSDVYSFGVVLLEMMSGRRSMDKNRPNGEHNLVEWARPLLGERQRFYKLIDPRLEGNFSVKGAQKAAQLARACLSRDPKARPLMSQVVEALKPLINLKDMASSSYFYQTMQAERMGHSSSMNGRNSHGIKTQGSFARNGQQPMRSLSDGPRASPFRYSPKPNVK
ncbi:hypothetical protein EJB05_42769 [Eragrostis curvula]|uniref:Protein kinase domain-containing protein n=1 Tax=Eragrostis curvula TaxID=38414 RepID=A0A5J9TD42_9POAL|nr:hypothetical protein EJB05_42753 [Eragrostis curvula]TVU09306.1 hypothetical protein EJB05_42769 [Eragrostis curvula]